MTDSKYMSWGFGHMQVGDVKDVPDAYASKLYPALSKWQSRHPGTLFKTHKSGGYIKVKRLA